MHRRRVSVLIHEPDRVEHLHRVVGVKAREELGYRAEVSIDELAQAAVVVDGPGARPPGHEQLEVRDAERVLDVDEEQAKAEGVVSGGAEAVLLRPRRRRAGQLLIRDPPYVADTARVVVRRERKLAHARLAV